MMTEEKLTHGAPLRELAARVADELAKLTGDPWEAYFHKHSESGEFYPRGDLRFGKDGNDFHVNIGLDERKQKVELSGNFHFGGSGGYFGSQYFGPSSYASEPRPSTSINCSASKSAETIAKDIARRLLPAYTEVYSDFHARYVSSCDYDARKAKTRSELFAAFGVTPSRHEVDSDELSWLSLDRGIGRVRFRDGVADIELKDVPADRFADLAKFAESISLGRKS